MHGQSVKIKKAHTSSSLKVKPGCSVLTLIRVLITRSLNKKKGEFCDSPFCLFLIQNRYLLNHPESLARRIFLRFEFAAISDEIMTLEDASRTII